MDKETTFWKMWNDELPGSFPKRRLTDDLEQRWNLTVSNVYARLKKEDFMYLASDLRFMYERYGIAFDYMGKGFFLDQKQYELIQQNEDMEAAKLFGLQV